jgi:iron(III) transport system permease protein
MTGRGRPGIWTATLVLAWLLVAVLLIYPVVTILSASFIDNGTGQFTLAHYSTMFGDDYYRRALFGSLFVGVCSMAGSLMLGLTLAFLTTRFVIRGSGLLSTLTILALATPSFVNAYAWIMMFGANGFIRTGLGSVGIPTPTIYGAGGIILVFVFKYFPYVYLLTANAFAAANRSVEEAAENLGTPPLACFFKVTLPLIFPALSSSALLTFVLSIADYGTPAVIGRGFHVLATEAYLQFSSELGGNLGMASTISIVLMAISLLFVALQRRLARRDRYGGAMMNRPIVKQLHGGRWLLSHVVCYAIVLIATLPSAVVVYYSFRRTRGPVFQPGFGFASYQRVLHNVSDAIVNSLIFSLSSVAFIVVLGTLIGYLLVRRGGVFAAWLDNVLMIPYIVPGIVMGIGFLAAFNQPPLSITGTGLIIVLVIFIRRLPYSVRSSAAILGQLSRSSEEAAISLGCSPAQAFMRVTLWLILPGVFAGALMSFVTAINELSSSLVLYVGSTITMPVRIYLSVLDGDYGTASALATILLAITAIAVLAALRLTRRDGRSII